MQKKKNVKAMRMFLPILLALPLLTHAQTVVVVSSKSSATILTAEQTVDIFLGKLSTLPGASSAIPVDLPEGSPVREDFYRKTTGKSEAQLTAYWSRILFTGKGHRPPEVLDSTAVKKFVANNPNAVGYLRRSDVDASVKIIFSVE
jgi:ABC-type phosphate transport system substrate-binding protein